MKKHAHSGTRTHHSFRAGGGHARGHHRPGPAAGGGISGMCGRYFLDDTKRSERAAVEPAARPSGKRRSAGFAGAYGRDLSRSWPRHRGGRGRREACAPCAGDFLAPGAGRGHQQPFGKGRFTPHVPARGAGAPLPGAGFRLLRMAAHSPPAEKRRKKFAFQSQGGVDKGLMYLAGVYGEFLGGFRAGGLTASPSSRARPMSRCALTTACP